MRNALRLTLSVAVAVISLSGLLTTRDAKALSCPSDTQCRSCSPYGYYCTSLSTGQTLFCEENCDNCVPVTEAEFLPTVNCKI